MGLLSGSPPRFTLAHVPVEWRKPREKDVILDMVLVTALIAQMWKPSWFGYLKIVWSFFFLNWLNLCSLFRFIWWSSHSWKWFRVFL